MGRRRSGVGAGLHRAGGSSADGDLKQVGTAQLTQDVSLTTTAISILLTRTITTQANTKLFIIATLHADYALAQGLWNARIRVDGVSQLPAYGINPGVVAAPMGIMLIALTAALSAGPHTVTLEWQHDTAGQARACKPATIPDQEHASIIALEIDA